MNENERMAPLEQHAAHGAAKLAIHDDILRELRHDLNDKTREATKSNNEAHREIHSQIAAVQRELNSVAKNISDNQQAVNSDLRDRITAVQELRLEAQRTDWRTISAFAAVTLVLLGFALTHFRNIDIRLERVQTQVDTKVPSATEWALSQERLDKQLTKQEKLLEELTSEVGINASQNLAVREILSRVESETLRERASLEAHALRISSLEAMLSSLTVRIEDLTPPR